MIQQIMTAGMETAAWETDIFQSLRRVKAAERK